MTYLRRLALASVIVGGLIGISVKIGTGGFLPPVIVLDWPKFTPGEKIGPFTFERLVDDDLQYWQLRSGQCEAPILMMAFSIKNDPNNKYIALHYPPTKWRALYVHRGQPYNTFDTFERIPALIRYLAQQLKTEMTLSKPDRSDEFFFSFLFPVECVPDPSAAVAASDALGKAL